MSRWRNLWLAPPFLWAILLLLGNPICKRGEIRSQPAENAGRQSLQSVQLIHKLQTWSAVVLMPASDVDTLRKVRDAVEKLPSVESTESILTAYDNNNWLTRQQAAAIPKPDYDPVREQDLPAISASARKLAAVFLAADAASEVPRRAGSVARSTRLFGIPQNRRHRCRAGA